MWELVRVRYPVLDTRSRGDLSIRVYDGGEDGQLLMAIPMQLVTLVRAQPKEQLEPVLPEALISGDTVLERLPDQRLLWLERYQQKADVLAQAIRWCEQLDVEESYYKSMRDLLSYINGKAKENVEQEQRIEQEIEGTVGEVQEESQTISWALLDEDVRPTEAHDRGDRLRGFFRRIKKKWFSCSIKKPEKKCKR